MTLKEDKQRARTSREELGKFYYGLANATFIGLVLGCFIPLVKSDIDTIAFVYMFSIGVTGTILFAMIGNYILKNK